MSRRSEERRQRREQVRAAQANTETLTAAGALATTGTTGSGAQATTARQDEAWSYFHIVPELFNAAMFRADLLARGALLIEVKDETDEWTPGVVNGTAISPLAAIADDALSVLGSHDRLIRAWSFSDLIPGEGYLVGTFGEPGWQFYSTREIKSQGGKWVWTKPRGDTGSTEIDEGMSVCRLWTPDPSMSDQAISPVLALLGTLAQMCAMDDAITAAGLSRALMGIFRVPASHQSPAPIGQAEGTDDGHPLQQQLIDVASMAIGSPRSASRFVPLVLPVADDVPEAAMKLIPLSAGLEGLPAGEFLDKAVLRFARGMPLPVEVVTGHAGTTFSNASEIARSLKADFVEPALERFTDDLTQRYLIPAIAPDPQSGDSTVDLSAVRIGFTVSDIRGPDIAALATAAKTLVDAGYDPAQVLDQVGLAPMNHTGVVTPSTNVTVGG